MNTRIRDLDHYWKTLHCPIHKGYYSHHIGDCKICRNIHRLQSQIGKVRAKLRVIEYLGGKCRRCGISDPRILVVNHIEGYKKGARSGNELYSGITSMKIPLEGLEILCFNCNILYEYERGNRIGFTNYQKYLSLSK